ncbi:MAG: DNA gyrase subunit A [Synergistaceae bacterium]|nr:DNA gyrase subunit A [Synergistaceae bacterium]
MSDEKLNQPIQQEITDPDEAGRIISLPLVGEIKTSYLNYAMSVIVGRAIPDARDGLKPVQRRVLYAMSELGLKHNTAYKKSARIVGETMGKYHPHGDSAIYDTMVRLAQNWNLRYCLVDGQGNFGSVDGDSAAAMRYTEARLSWPGEIMLANLDEDTVDWAQNFDESLKEPMTLPSILPNLLVNGSTGIAVGMATNMPPHNLNEVTQVLCWLIENNVEPEDADLHKIMEIMPAPDFPTGGEILGRAGIYEAYSTGRGKILIRGKMHTEQSKRSKKTRIIITEIPFNVNKTILLETMVTAVQDKQIEGITEIRDESDRDGLRIVVEVAKDLDPDLIMRKLYKHTQLQTTYGIINLALVNQHSEILPVKNLLGIYLNYRRDVVRRRTEYRLRQAQAREHIIEGLKKALANIEQVIKIIRGTNSAQEAKENLQTQLEFSDVQTQAILDMRLQRLTGLERSRLDDEQNKLLADIESYNHILGDKKTLDGVIHDELIEIASRFGDKRRTEIIDTYEEVPDEAMIAESDIVITLSQDGFIKRQPVEFYKLQAKGGKGRKGANIQEDDSISLVSVTHTHKNIYFFTNRGRVMSVKGYEIPETKSGKGKPVNKTLPLLQENERIVNIAAEDETGCKYLFFITKLGKAKRTSLEEMRSSNRAKKVMNVDEGDEIAQVRLTNGENDLLIMTVKGQALRVSEQEFRAMGRTAGGIKAIRLSGNNDKVLSCDVVDKTRKVLLISEHGLGKRTDFDEFTPHHRGTGGIKIMNLNHKTGKLAACLSVKDNDEMLVITSKGMMIRIDTGSISNLSRTATGSTILRLNEGDTVADCSVIRAPEEDSDDSGVLTFNDIDGMNSDLESESEAETLPLFNDISGDSDNNDENS